jgi:hypothetical protein
MVMMQWNLARPQLVSGVVDQRKVRMPLLPPLALAFLMTRTGYDYYDFFLTFITE